MTTALWTLRERCTAFLETLGQGSPTGRPSVDDLLAFVTAETGRNADSRLKEALPLCLYFATPADREDFITAFGEAKWLGLITKVVP